MSKKNPVRHLRGAMAGSVQKGLVEYTLCGKKATPKMSLLSSAYSEGPPADCVTCCKVVFQELEEKLVYHRKEIDAVMPVWRKYTWVKTPSPFHHKPSEF